MRKDVDQQQYYKYKIGYLRDRGRGKRADEYLEKISSPTLSNDQLAMIALLFEPEFGLRTAEWKQMTRAVMWAIGFAVYWGKRTVTIPHLGQLEAKFYPHRDRDVEAGVRRRKWTWKFRLNTRKNKRANLNRDLYRHRMMGYFATGIEQPDYEALRYKSFQEYITKYTPLTWEEYLAKEPDERKKYRELASATWCLENAERMEAKLEQTKNKRVAKAQERAEAAERSMRERAVSLGEKIRQAREKMDEAVREGLCDDGGKAHPDGSSILRPEDSPGSTVG